MESLFEKFVYDFPKKEKKKQFKPIFAFKKKKNQIKKCKIFAISKYANFDFSLKTQ